MDAASSKNEKYYDVYSNEQLDSVKKYDSFKGIRCFLGSAEKVFVKVKINENEYVKEICVNKAELAAIKGKRFSALSEVSHPKEPGMLHTVRKKLSDIAPSVFGVIIKDNNGKDKIISSKEFLNLCMKGLSCGDETHLSDIKDAAREVRKIITKQLPDLEKGQPIEVNLKEIQKKLKVFIHPQVAIQYMLLTGEIGSAVELRSGYYGICKSADTSILTKVHHDNGLSQNYLTRESILNHLG